MAARKTDFSHLNPCSSLQYLPISLCHFVNCSLPTPKSIQTISKVLFSTRNVCLWEEGSYSIVKQAILWGEHFCLMAKICFLLCPHWQPCFQQDFYVRLVLMHHRTDRTIYQYLIQPHSGCCSWTKHTFLYWAGTTSNFIYTHWPCRVESDGSVMFTPHAFSFSLPVIV